MKKVLLFTDSRGVHKPGGSTHHIYSERLPRVPGLQVTSLRCPFQWTTIPDFLDVVATRYRLDDYDHVILHAGIVDHSPRPLQQALHNLYDPETPTDPKVVETLFAKRNFSTQKIINRKKTVLDRLFGEAAMCTHFAHPFDQKYEGDCTINLYSMAMMLEHIVPRLKAIPNLIFIGSNDFVPGWNGDFPKKRPDNIRMIEDYSRQLCHELPHVINLHQWTPDQIKEFTTDNLHLSAKGSDWIFLRVLEELGLRRRDYVANRRHVGIPEQATPWPLRADDDPATIQSIRFDEPQVLQDAEVEALQKRLGREGKPLATMVIGLRIQKDESSRLDNLRFLLGWFKRFYGRAFEILLVEQDVKQTRELYDELPDGFRYEFLYNPEAYNRGWLYNVAVRQFTDCPVVGFCDTDILPGGNFLQCVLDCYEDFDAVSPNRNLYYSTEKQKRELFATGSYLEMPLTEQALKNPTSLSGGMLIVNREKFLQVGGFEQYVGYGCEDRALDVTMLALLPLQRLRMDSYAYFHMHHPTHATEHVYFKDIYSHCVEHFGCEFTRGMTPMSYIHRNCAHDDIDKVRAMAESRRPAIGDPNLYRDNSYVTVNGLPPQFNGKLIPVAKPEPVFPPSLVLLGDYRDKEEFLGRYAGGWAPPVRKDQEGDDTDELSFFYNRFKGRRCFIIGNGPSLNRCDLSLLANNEYTFAVNSFYYKTRETGFKPTFFVVEDSSVIKENTDEIVGFDAPFKFFPTIYRSLHPKKPGTYFFRINRGFYEKSSPNYGIPRFSTDITKVAYCGQSVTYINLQLAFFMGFTEVFLIGMDFDYVIPESHQRTGDVLLSDTDDPNHFHKDYFGKGKTWKDPKLDRVLMNYKMARLVYECAGRRIYNATVGGKLEAFERVSFEGLFRGLDPSFRSEPLDLTRPHPRAVAPAATPAVARPPAKPAVAPTAAPKPLVASALAATAAAPAERSIAAAWKLFADKEFTACAKMCDELHKERGLGMYNDLAALARRHLQSAAS